MKRALILLAVVTVALVLGVLVGTYMASDERAGALAREGQIGVTSLATQPSVAGRPERRRPKPQLQTNATEESNTNTTAPLPVTKLTPEKEAHIKEAWRRFPSFGSQTNIDHAQVVARRIARLDYLSAYLTSEELLYYRLNRDPFSSLLHRAFDRARFKLSDEEFQRVFLALEFDDLNNHQGGYVEFFGLLPAPAEDKLKEALGPHRYADYLELHLPYNWMLSGFAEQYRLDDETFDKIRVLRDSAPRNGDRDAWTVYSNSVSILLAQAVEFEHRRRQAIQEFFFGPGLTYTYPRPQKAK